MYTYIHVYIYIYTYVYIHIYIYTYVYYTASLRSFLWTQLSTSERRFTSEVPSKLLQSTRKSAPAGNEQISHLDSKITIFSWWLGHPSEKYEFVNWDD